RCSNVDQMARQVVAPQGFRVGTGVAAREFIGPVQPVGENAVGRLGVWIVGHAVQQAKDDLRDGVEGHGGFGVAHSEHIEFARRGGSLAIGRSERGPSERGGERRLARSFASLKWQWWNHSRRWLPKGLGDLLSGWLQARPTERELRVFSTSEARVSLGGIDVKNHISQVKSLGNGASFAAATARGRLWGGRGVERLARTHC